MSDASEVEISICVRSKSCTTIWFAVCKNPLRIGLNSGKVKTVHVRKDPMKSELFRAFFALSFALASRAFATTHYVDAGGTNPISPFTDWSTAATNIQDVINAANTNDRILVTNGLYQLSGYNPVAYVTKTLTLQSVNGPSVTVIDGQSSKQCVILVSGAVISGFTIKNGSAASGGGIRCQASDSLVTNCVIAGNSSFDTSQGGGGIYSGTAINCVISNNTALHSGGGAYSSTLINCILSGNSARVGGGGAASDTAPYVLLNCVLTGNRAGYVGGGAAGGSLANCVLFGNYSSNYAGGASSTTLINCTVISNSAAQSPGGVYTSRIANSILYYNSTPIASDANYAGFTISNSCTTPLPSGADNFTNTPLFVDLAGGDFHLQSGSHCINAGNNASLNSFPFGLPGFLSITNDPDAHPRIIGGTVDVGAFEFQSPSSIISYVWLQQYGFPTNGSADFLDPDGDQMNNWQEWLAGTNPTNSASVLRMFNPLGGAPNITLRWQSVTNRTYSLLRSTNLSSFQYISATIPGQSNVTTFTDATATGQGPFFYRVTTHP
jgi:hypothetical protein